MKRLILLLALSPLFCVNTFATEEEGTKAQQDQTVAGTGKVLDISHRYVNTGKYKEPKQGDPVEMAYEFFELNRQEFHMGDPRKELVYQGTRGSKLTGGKRVDFGQVYKGVPVHLGGFKVLFSPSGVIEGIGGKYYYDIHLSTTPQIDSATAENLALKDLGFPKDAKVVNNNKVSTRLNIWRSNDGKFHLMWTVWVSQEYPKAHAWKYFIDAHDGTVLQKTDEIIRN